MSRFWSWSWIMGVCLAMGCASSPITVRYGPPVEGGFIDGSMPSLVEVKVQPEAYGRVCYDVAIDPKGKVHVTIAQDGSSDWAGIRALPMILPEIVGAVMAVVGAPMDVAGQLLGLEPEQMPEPSAVSACSAIFED